MEVKDKIENSLEHGVAYLHTRFEAMVLSLSDKVAHSVSSLAMAVIIWTFLKLIILFLSFSVAWWLGEKVDSIPAGFLVVAGFYLLLGLIVYVVVKKVIRPKIVNELLKKWHYDR